MRRSSFQLILYLYLKNNLVGTEIVQQLGPFLSSTSPIWCPAPHGTFRFSQVQLCRTSSHKCGPESSYHIWETLGILCTIRTEKHHILRPLHGTASLDNRELLIGPCRPPEYSLGAPNYIVLIIVFNREIWSN